MRRIEKLCDSVIRLESFAGSVKEQNPVYKEYHGDYAAGPNDCSHDCQLGNRSTSSAAIAKN